MKTPKDYDVGFGKAPVHARFKKGQSGNPSGRRKGRVNLATVVNRVLSEKITVTDKNGERSRMTKFQATLTGLVNRAVKGDARATQQFLQELAPIFGADASAGNRPLDSNEALVVAGLLERLAAGAQKKSDTKK